MLVTGSKRSEMSARARPVCAPKKSARLGPKTPILRRIAFMLTASRGVVRFAAFRDEIISFRRETILLRGEIHDVSLGGGWGARRSETPLETRFFGRDYGERGRSSARLPRTGRTPSSIRKAPGVV